MISRLHLLHSKRTGNSCYICYALSNGIMRASPCIMLALLMSEYRRRCPVASWGDMERLWRIVARDLHVDSAMPCCYLVAWCDAYARPACRCIPAWIPANHRPIVQAIERSYLGERVELGDFARRGGGLPPPTRHPMPGTGAGCVSCR